MYGNGPVDSSFCLGTTGKCTVLQVHIIYPDVKYLVGAPAGIELHQGHVYKEGSGMSP